MEVSASSKASSDGWLDGFWGQRVHDATTAVPTPSPVSAPASYLPEPGTLFLIVMAIVTAVWQRIAGRRR